MKNPKLHNEAMQKRDENFLSTRKNAYMVPFFNFLYYFGYFPFKVVFDADADKYFIKTHAVQQVRKVTELAV